MTNNIERVKLFVSKYWSVPLKKLSQNTKLEDDLGITGDDAAEFFNLFSTEFNVDLTDLNLQKYFESEGIGLLNFSWLLGKRRKVKRSLHEITIADLENTLEHSKWIDPIEQKPQ